MPKSLRNEVKKKATRLIGDIDNSILFYFVTENATEELKKYLWNLKIVCTEFKKVDDPLLSFRYAKFGVQQKTY